MISAYNHSINDDPLVRAYLAIAMGATRDEFYSSELIKGLKDDERESRLAAIQAVGMVQSKKNSDEVYKIGCLGKISLLEKTEDGRILIKLTGITRFEIIKEISNNKLYREFKVQYNKFYQDIENMKLQTLEEKKLEILLEKIKIFFKKNGLLLNWKEFKRLEQIQQINTLAMILPFSDEEKQKLLEIVGLNEKIKIFSEIIEFYLHDKGYKNKITIQ